MLKPWLSEPPRAEPGYTASEIGKAVRGVPIFGVSTWIRVNCSKKTVVAAFLISLAWFSRVACSDFLCAFALCVRLIPSGRGTHAKAKRREVVRRERNYPTCLFAAKRFSAFYSVVQNQFRNTSVRPLLPTVHSQHTVHPLGCRSSCKTAKLRLEILFPMMFFLAANIFRVPRYAEWLTLKTRILPARQTRNTPVLVLEPTGGRCLAPARPIFASATFFDCVYKYGHDHPLS